MMNTKRADIDTDINQLLKENEMLKMTLDGVPEAIYVVDKNSHIHVINKACEIIDEIKREDAIGKTEYEVYGVAPFFEEVVTEVFRSGTSIKNQYFSYIRPNGKLYTFFYSAYPLRKNNDIPYVLTIWRSTDQIGQLITDTYELQQKLIREEHPHKLGRTKFFLNDIITADEVMLTNIEIARQTARHDSPIMLQGETGSGKELFAQGIHNAGPRPKSPFIPVNCSAIPENLLESTLFGTVRGAFTNAVDLPGLFEQAKNGTIFLDEINSLPLHLQPKLLRVLQEKMVRRIGSKYETEIHCRFISALNVDPFAAIEKGTLRSDLFFRLSPRIISIPSLRERHGDIELLTNHFITKFNLQYGKNIQSVAEELGQLFLNYDWPGNVRELENILEGAISFAHVNETTLCIGHIPNYVKERIKKTISNENTVPAAPETVNLIKLRHNADQAERQRVTKALCHNKYNLTQTAKELGLSRQTLTYRLKKMGYVFDSPEQQK